MLVESVFWMLECFIFIAMGKCAMFDVFFPLAMIALGILSIMGVDTFGSAFFEIVPWKQHAIYCLLLTFCLLPNFLRNVKLVYTLFGYAIGFMIFGGSNYPHAVFAIMSLFKFLLPLLLLGQAYRLWLHDMGLGKYIMILPVVSFVIAFFIFPIEDANMVKSLWRGISEFSIDAYRSDDGFHVLFGALSLTVGLTEGVIVYNDCFKSKNYAVDF